MKLPTFCRNMPPPIAEAGYTVEDIADEAELYRRIAAAIVDGKVVGWFQGRIEWGPRALGNRSIVCDPRRADMKSICAVRGRTFRRRMVRRKRCRAFMMQVFQIRPDKRSLIPAVTHVDGSGRLQTVSRRTNPLYYQLFEKFRDIIGVPMVLNTSSGAKHARPLLFTPASLPKMATPAGRDRRTFFS
jgi:carbamoyltransferase